MEEKEYKNNCQNDSQLEKKANIIFVKNDYNIKNYLVAKLYILALNTIFLFVLISVLIIAAIKYKRRWRFFFFISSWSYIMTLYYLASVVIIDFSTLFYNNSLYIYNNFIRNIFIKICVPFNISSVFIYWELVLLGNNFQKNEKDIYDIIKNIFINGIILLFLLFDMFTSVHFYKYNRLCDIFVLTVIMFAYYILVSLGKYLNAYEPYNFMLKSDVRQMVAVGIICYLILLNGYIVYDLLAYYIFFKNQTITKPSEFKSYISSGIF